MSTNIKVNPFSIAGNWNNAGLDSVIAALPGSPSPEDVVDKVSIYLSTKMYNAAIYADNDVGCHAFLPPALRYSPSPRCILLKNLQWGLYFDPSIKTQGRLAQHRLSDRLLYNRFYSL